MPFTEIYDRRGCLFNSSTKASVTGMVRDS